MTQRLEVHRDYLNFFQHELDALADVSVAASYWEFFQAVHEVPNGEFDEVVCKFAESMQWPDLRAEQHVQACLRLHFAWWFVQALPWETTERPLDGAAYLKDVLMRQYGKHKREWIAACWAGWLES